MRFKVRQTKDYTYIIGYSRINTCQGSLQFLGAKVFGFVYDEYYDGESWSLHFWNYCVYFDKRHTPDGKQIS